MMTLEHAKEQARMSLRAGDLHEAMMSMMSDIEKLGWPERRVKLGQQLGMMILMGRGEALDRDDVSLYIEGFR